MKRYLALLLSVVMVVTFMPTMAFAEEDDGGHYHVELCIDNTSEMYNADVLPGDAFTLNAKLCDDDNEGAEITSEVEFRIEEVENNAFESPDSKIVSYTEDDGKNDGSWDCQAQQVFADDNISLLNGNAIFGVTAIYQGKEYRSWDVNIGVSARPGYEDLDIMRGDGYSRLDLEPDESGSFELNLKPYYANKTGFDFDFEVGFNEYNEGEDRDEFVQTEYTGYDIVGNDLSMDRTDIMTIIKNHDPSFVIRVITKGTVEAGGDAIFGCDEITVNVMIPNLFEKCYIDFPSSIKFVPGQTIYDEAKNFVLKSKKDGSVIAEDKDNLYEWRFVDTDPDLLDTPEKADAASVLTSDGKLRLDHMGRYWVVAAGAVTYNEDGYGVYTGFIIESFELTDKDVYYKSKPKAIENLTYDDDNDIALVTEGVLNEGADAKIQYRLDNGAWGDDVPTVKKIGDYTVSYKVVSPDATEEIIPEESTRVIVNRKPVIINLMDKFKAYGTPDPSLTVAELISPESLEEIPAELIDQITFSRERGEDAIDEGYRISAHCESDKYEILISEGRLYIERANYHLAVMDNFSFNADDAGELTYITDAPADKVVVEHDEESGLEVEIQEGKLSITATAQEACSDDIELIVEGDDNHNGTSQIIHVEATESLASATAGGGNFGGSVAAKSDNKMSFGDGLTLSVTALDPSSPGAVNIGLSNSEGEISTYSNARMVVKVKLTDELEGLRGGTEPTAQTGSEDPINGWFEYVGEDAYFCFETEHLSPWTLSAKPAEDLKRIENPFSLNIAVGINAIKDNDGNYIDLNFGEDVLRDEEGNVVDPSCYRLVFNKADQNEDLYAISEPGSYNVKAVAIEGMGYKGVVELDGTIIVGQPCDHEYSNIWSFNSEIHWKGCTNACGTNADVGEHVYDQNNTDSKYLVSAKTCSEYAQYRMSCICGAVGQETFSDIEGGLASHVLDPVSEKPFSETENGYKAHYKCITCGACFKDKSGTVVYPNDELYIVAHSHTSLEYHEAKAATVTEQGNKEYWYCPVCNKCFKDKDGKEEIQLSEMIIPSQQGEITNAFIIAGKVVIGASIATVAIIKTVDTLVKKAEAVKKAEEAAKILEEAKTAAKDAIGEALGESTDPVVGAYFDEGFEAVAAAETPDEVLEATVKYVNLINEAKTVVETKIKLNKATAQKNGKIKITFENPGLDGVVSYHVERSNKKDFSKNLTTRKVKAKDKDTIVYYNTKNLKKGKKYYYQVYAKVKLSDGNVVETNLSNVRSAKCKKTR